MISLIRVSDFVNSRKRYSHRENIKYVQNMFADEEKEHKVRLISTEGRNRDGAQTPLSLRTCRASHDNLPFLLRKNDNADEEI